MGSKKQRTAAKEKAFDIRRAAGGLQVRTVNESDNVLTGESGSEMMLSIVSRYSCFFCYTKVRSTEQQREQWDLYTTCIQLTQ